SWDPTSTQLGWVHRSATADWSAPGAFSAGSDTVAGKTFRVPALRPVGPQTGTIPLDTAQVQAWFDTPSPTQGIMLVNTTAVDIISPIATTGTQSMRPMLTIVTSGATGVS